MYEYKVIPCIGFTLQQMQDLYETMYKKQWNLLWIMSNSFIMIREIPVWKYVFNEIKASINLLLYKR
jgi:hypothetical protein